MGIPISKKGPDGKKLCDKIRPIVLAPVESRIVQRSVLDTLTTVSALSPYYDNPFSFGGIRKGLNELGAVPAAVHAVLKAAGEGGTHVAFADIRSFFTKVSKTTVSSIVSEAVQDIEFMEFFSQAIKVELDNLNELKEKASAFPTFEIGVAQGNCLSPLLGNIILHEFDFRMNEGDCRCVRYIDDFIIIAPNAKAAKARMKRAVKILDGLGMELSPEKSSKSPLPISETFSFLGVEFANGPIRPAPKARANLLQNINNTFNRSIHSMNTFRSDKGLDRSHSLIATLRRVDGIITGWGKHFRFCNDGVFFANLDTDVSNLIAAYLGRYRETRLARNPSDSHTLLGIQQLSRIDRKPLLWPKKSKVAT